MSAFQVTFLLIVLVLMVRNLLTGHVTQKRLHEIHEKHLRQIEVGVEPDLGEYEATSGTSAYASNVFDLRKWTYRQFFPEVL